MATELKMEQVVPCHALFILISHFQDLMQTDKQYIRTEGGCAVFLTPPSVSGYKAGC